MLKTATVRTFDDIGLSDIAEVGGKNASLGEMRRALASAGVRVPNGFATTASAYRAFLDETNLKLTIAEALRDLDVQDVAGLQRRGALVREAILAAPLPAWLVHDIEAAYMQLESEYGGGCDVAVRSSATAEDLPAASFAGQLESFLNVRGNAQLMEAVHRCFASLYTDRAISYRVQHGFGAANVALCVGVQKMIRSDRAGAGVMFSLDPESGFRDAVIISAAWGLGEAVVQGTVQPDEYVVFKPTLHEGYRPILRKTIGSKLNRTVYDDGVQGGIRVEAVSETDRKRTVLTDDEILTLARWASSVERHYTAIHGAPTPMDMEWAKDADSNELFLVQARPETVHSQRSATLFERYHLIGAGNVLVQGQAVGDRIGQGRARIIRSVADSDQLQPGEVLIAEVTDPDWEPVMKRSAALVTDRGGRTCHAAIVSRELGIPAVVGTGNATSKIVGGQEITVSCAEGELGNVYDGALEFRVERVEVDKLREAAIDIMLNIADPAKAFALSFLPNDGVGLARMEFIIASQIRVHPMALLQPEKVVDVSERTEIERLVESYPRPADYFVDKLAQGVATIAAAFWPKDVIVRFSDFKTNEYAGLLGGAAFEPREENPMLGFRGASRYYDDRYRTAFALECAAILRVRETMGLRNVKVMIPFCRTVAEGRRVLEEMAANKLIRGQNGLEVYVMCEIPSNVILAKEFAEIFDGFSIGSNDLTQLVLGLDRDSELVAHLFDERNDAVKRVITQVIASVHSAGRKIGLCGQAPSDYPEFARFLVEAGIDSISLSADAIVTTTLALTESK